MYRWFMIGSTDTLQTYQWYWYWYFCIYVSWYVSRYVFISWYMCHRYFTTLRNVTQNNGHCANKVTDFLTNRSSPSPPLDDIRVMVIVWRLRGNIIRTALCWIVWHYLHSQQHTYMSSSYRSNRLGLSHWDHYTVRRGGCLELYYCNMVECFWWDLGLIFDDQLVSFSALTLLVWSSARKMVPKWPTLTLITLTNRMPPLLPGDLFNFL